MELARDCVRACHVLKTMTEGKDADNLSGLSQRRAEQIEDLGRCVNPDRLSLLKITSDTRIVRHIESVVSERAKCGHGSLEHHPEPTKECLIAWQMEMWEILRVFDVRGFQFIIATVSKLP